MIVPLFTLLNLIIHLKYKLIDLIGRTFQREGSRYLACKDINARFSFQNSRKILRMVLVKCMRCADVFVGQHFFIRFDTKLYRQVVGILLFVLPRLRICSCFVMKGTF